MARERPDLDGQIQELILEATRNAQTEEEYWAMFWDLLDRLCNWDTQLQNIINKEKTLNR